MRGRRSDAGASPLVAVLAGGVGRRLGGAKPGVLLGGRPLVSYPVRAARAAGLAVVVVAKRSSPLPGLDCEIVAEPEHPRHPLCGLVAAIQYARDRPVLALACDMPFITGTLLAWLGGAEGVVVVEANGSIQPLLARYPPASLPLLERALEQRLSLRAAVAMLEPRVVGECELRRFGDPDRLCFNVNEPSELVLAERWLA